MGKHLIVPAMVRIFYRHAGRVHVFTSPDMRGLHVGHSDLRQAFALIPQAVSGLVELETGVEAVYEAEVSFEEFEAQLSNNSSDGLAEPVLKIKVGAHLNDHSKLRFERSA
jgi:hypothetical protein